MVETVVMLAGWGCVAFAAWMFLDCVRNEAHSEQRVFWAVLIAAVPLVGPLLYFVAVYRCRAEDQARLKDLGEMRPLDNVVARCNELFTTFSEGDRDVLEADERRVVDEDALAGLREVPFERVRNRCRVLAGLNPGKSAVEETGLVRLSYRHGETMKDVEIKLVFPVTGDCFRLERVRR